jgi:Tfp pilus assembly protein PilN
MYKDELEIEQEQLDAKVKKLEAFLTDKDKLKDLKLKQIQLLHKQLSGMKTYLEALTERIKNL